MNLRIGFEAPGDNAISRGIAELGEPHRFSHVALIFGDALRWDAHIQYGVRFHDDIPDGDRWTFVDPGLLPGEVETVRQWCELQSGKGYDTFGALAAAKVPLTRSDPDKWFCSSGACAALQTVDVFEGLTSRLTLPNSLYLACAGMTVL